MHAVRPRPRVELGDGCPVGPSSLKAVSLNRRDIGASVRTGTFVIHRDIEWPARRAFAALFGMRFPLESIRPVSDFDPPTTDR